MRLSWQECQGLYMYLIIDSKTNQILHFENVDNRGVGLRSPNMEREGIS